MTKKEAIKIFEEKKVRTLWDDETEEWYFSIVDVVSVLTDSVDGRKYWNKLKQRLKAEGSELVTNCHQLKLPTADGKYYKTDVATTEQLFRLIQSIPSPKAEPFKLWMTQVAKERLDEMQDPERTIDRAMMEYKNLGYSDHWINQRLKSIEIRKDLTDELTLNMLAEAVTTELSKERIRNISRNMYELPNKEEKQLKLPENNWKVIWDIRLFSRLMQKRG